MAALGFVLAFLVESMVEYIFAKPLDFLGDDLREWILPYIALAVGVFAAWQYNLDIIAEFFGKIPTWPGLGFIITGLIIGRGADYFHQVVQAILDALNGVK